MTGNEVKRIREALGLSVMNLAALQSVNFTTVYRWERGGNCVLNAEGMSRLILGWLQEVAAECGEVGFHAENLRARLERFGVLGGLGYLMGWVEGVRSRKGVLS